MVLPDGKNVDFSLLGKFAERDSPSFTFADSAAEEFLAQFEGRGCSVLGATKPKDGVAVTGFYKDLVSHK